MQPGDDVQISFPSAGNPPKPLHASFTVVDLYESKMSEYDSQFVFVPLGELQDFRRMIDPSTGVSNARNAVLTIRRRSARSAATAR